MKRTQTRTDPRPVLPGRQEERADLLHHLILHLMSLRPDVTGFVSQTASARAPQQWSHYVPISCVSVMNPRLDPPHTASPNELPTGEIYSLIG